MLTTLECVGELVDYLRGGKAEVSCFVDISDFETRVGICSFARRYFVFVEVSRRAAKDWQYRLIYYIFLDRLNRDVLSEEKMTRSADVIYVLNPLLEKISSIWARPICSTRNRVNGNGACSIKYIIDHLYVV